jgi:hypothetical protein
MKINLLPVGSLVYVTCHGPCWGLRGIIRAVDVIAPTDEQWPLCFYFVALQEGQMKEPLWLVHDDIAEVEGENVSQWRSSREKLSRLEFEALGTVANVSERERDRSLELVLTT